MRPTLRVTGSPSPPRITDTPATVLARWAAVCLSCCCGLSAGQDIPSDPQASIAPDIRADDTALKVQRGDFVVVPIPLSNPTLETGLVAGAAYFYPQSEAEKQQQPASLTALGVLYTSNDSKGLALLQQNYWDADRWRFTGVAGAADLRLSLIAPEDGTDGRSVDWRVDGQFLLARLSRRLRGDWYAGGFARLIDANQFIETDVGSADFDTGSRVRAVGIGAAIEFDTRDMPTNAYTGRYFKFDALFNEEAIGSESSYQSYLAAFRSYHRVHESVVLAWTVQGCRKEGTAPLWDACRLPLRGFSVTDHLGRTSVSGQIEGRWRVKGRWGLAAFAGSGWVGSSFSEAGRDQTVPSYGVGLRYEVLPAKRVNLRLDFARSRDSDAIHLAVGEAF